MRRKVIVFFVILITGILIVYGLAISGMEAGPGSALTAIVFIIAFIAALFTKKRM